ncbi:MAG: sensor histidine kinase [Rhodocyclaceae bacterium]|nr:MAG: sensor histidine kinase [Rhodocyclaceae bacterium]
MVKERESIRQFPLPPASAALLGGARLWRRLGIVSALVVAVVVAAAGLMGFPWAPVLAGSVPTALLLLLWFVRSRYMQAPAMTEARLMALSARIRPHFLFNSLNAVLGTIRSDPRRAETALEELAELFRALLQDPKELVPLSEELSLCRKYLALERLRLGDRIQVNWDINSCPPDALMPPLMLQPLLENAVYHGVEPLVDPGCISIRMVSAGGMLVLELSNPFDPRHGHGAGNRMALGNIRERLALFYGQGATLDSETIKDRYVVRIVLPYYATSPTGRT